MAGGEAGTGGQEGAAAQCQNQHLCLIVDRIHSAIHDGSKFISVSLLAPLLKQVCTISDYRVVQLILTPEIKAFYMLSDRSLS